MTMGWTRVISERFRTKVRRGEPGKLEKSGGPPRSLPKIDALRIHDVAQHADLTLARRLDVRERVGDAERPADALPHLVDRHAGIERREHELAVRGVGLEHALV